MSQPTIEEMVAACKTASDDAVFAFEHEPERVALIAAAATIASHAALLGKLRAKCAEWETEARGIQSEDCAAELRVIIAESKP